jgi:hypothetical protein
MERIKRVVKRYILKLYLGLTKLLVIFISATGLRWLSYHMNYLFWKISADKIYTGGSIKSYELDLYAEMLAILISKYSKQPGMKLNETTLKRVLEVYYRVNDLVLKEENNKFGNLLIKNIEKASLEQLNFLAASNQDTIFKEDYSIKLEPEFFDQIMAVDVASRFKETLEPQVTVVYPFRDRNVERLSLSIRSLVNSSTAPFKVTVVDYGSTEKFKKELETFCVENGVHLIRTETEGLPWSRAQALNIGMKAADTPYVATTDIDMVFDSDIISASIENYTDGIKIHCKPLWIGEDGLRSNAWLGDHYQLGGYMFASKSTFEKFGYFNNDIFYWGIEDIELNQRLNNKGIETTWIEEKAKMYHIWHTPSYGDFDLRPLSSWFDSNHLLMETTLRESHRVSSPIKVIDSMNRPILKLMQEYEPLVIKIKSYINDVDKIKEAAKKTKFIMLDLNSRIDSKSFALKTNLRYIESLLKESGTELSVMKNKNFDFFYLSLDLLTEIGLADYYIKEDYSAVYLFFK